MGRPVVAPRQGVTRPARVARSGHICIRARAGRLEARDGRAPRREPCICIFILRLLHTLASLRPPGRAFVYSPPVRRSGEAASARRPDGARAPPKRSRADGRKAEGANLSPSRRASCLGPVIRWRRSGREARAAASQSASLSGPKPCGCRLWDGRPEVLVRNNQSKI